VRRGLRTPLLVGDLPFGSYEVSDEQAGADGVPLREGGRLRRGEARGRRPRPRRPRPRDRAGRHPRDGPRRPDAADRDRARRLPRAGAVADAAAAIAREALALQEAGCFSLVFEAIPTAVAAELMEHMEALVIGIGAGPATDGQVLVFHDLLGIREGRGARFVQRYADLQEEMDAGVAAFAEDVRSARYPQPEHGYSIDDGELARFRAALAEAAGAPGAVAA
jgi:3-methyl-2-oxobutanoate hydroxymethyltransferase